MKEERFEELVKSFETDIENSNDIASELPDTFSIGSVLLFRRSGIDDRVAIKTGDDRWVLSGRYGNDSWVRTLKTCWEEHNMIIFSLKADEVIYFN